MSVKLQSKLGGFLRMMTQILERLHTSRAVDAATPRRILLRLTSGGFELVGVLNFPA